MSPNKDIVLVTGGSGFLGQHIIKLLIQEQKSLGIDEIRSLDLKPYQNKIGHTETDSLVTFIGDICKPDTIEDIFAEVSCVFHCAGMVSLQYPPNYKELDMVNYQGTANVVDLCLKHNVKALVYTSCASVNFVPYMGHSTFSIIINQTESKASTPSHDLQKEMTAFDKEFLIPGYSATKLRAEKLVLNSTGASLQNGYDYLHTVALRPPLIYGEGDNHFMPELLKYLSTKDNKIPRISGAGGKHQVAYAGNVAWAHICAYKTLKTTPKKISGLPVFVTDETPVNDISRFVQRIGRESETMKFDQTWWYIPHFLFFFMAYLIEVIVGVLHPFTGTKLQYSLRSLAAFTSSVIMFNRMRACIHMDYEPLFDEDTSFKVSGKWYEKWLRENRSKASGEIK